MTEPASESIRRAARQALQLDDDALLSSCEVDVFVGSGPGGQHRNKTESAVRLTHRDTGVVVTAAERRSQHENKLAAIVRLRERLKSLLFVPKKRRPTRPTRGSKERRLAEKKRTSEKKRLRRYDE